MINSTHLYVGSKNQTKINAVHLALQELKIKGISVPALQVVGEDVPSGVNPQPMSDEETIQGAINRCMELKKMYPDGICIGLEGGVQQNLAGLFVCNWGAMLDEHGNQFIASGARVRLPDIVASGISDGKELGDMMDSYAQKVNVRKKEGAIGILTEGILDRSSMFAQVALLLFGQMLHAKGQFPDTNK